MLLAGRKAKTHYFSPISLVFGCKAGAVCATIRFCTISMFDLRPFHLVCFLYGHVDVDIDPGTTPSCRPMPTSPRTSTPSTRYERHLKFYCAAAAAAAAAVLSAVVPAWSDVSFTRSTGVLPFLSFLFDRFVLFRSLCRSRQTDRRQRGHLADEDDDTTTLYYCQSKS